MLEVIAGTLGLAQSIMDATTSLHAARAAAASGPQITDDPGPDAYIMKVATEYERVRFIFKHPVLTAACLDVVIDTSEAKPQVRFDYSAQVSVVTVGVEAIAQLAGAGGVPRGPEMDIAKFEANGERVLPGGGKKWPEPWTDYVRACAIRAVISAARQLNFANDYVQSEYACKTITARGVDGAPDAGTTTVYVTAPPDPVDLPVPEDLDVTMFTRPRFGFDEGALTINHDALKAGTARLEITYKLGERTLALLQERACKAWDAGWDKWALWSVADGDLATVDQSTELVSTIVA